MTNDLFPAIEMTEACNKKCVACLRPTSHGARNTSYAQLRAYLDDLRALSQNHRIRHQFVTGGEPTIWKDDGKDIVDVLAAVDELEAVEFITMPTNGKVFEDLDQARALLTRISERVSHPLIVGLSIAEYQHNLDEHGCVALDHLLQLCRDGVTDAFPVALVTLTVEDTTSEELTKRYPNVYQRVTPLAPMGRALDMTERCPSLCLSGHDKRPVGSFLPHFEKDVTGKLRLDADEFALLPNDELMNRLSLYCNCGKSPFIDSTWHYCLPMREDPAFDLAEIGHMQADTIADFVAQRPVLQSIRKRGLIDTVRRGRDALSNESRERLDELLGEAATVSVAYRGCMICKALYDRGIISELLALGAP